MFFYETDILKGSFCCDLMKKQRYPWVFVIIFQGSVKRTGGEEKSFSLCFMLFKYPKHFTEGPDAGYR